MKRKFLALILSVLMLVSLLPTAAFAAEGTTGCSDPCAHGAAITVDETTTHYDTLEDAIAAVPTDGTETTIKMLANITEMTTAQILKIASGQNVVLDMAGHSITVANDFQGRPIENRGTLKVTGNGTIDSTASASGGYGAINNFGTLTIENGTFRGATSANGSAIYNRPNATLTINNGTFDTATRAVANSSQATINNGSFTGTTCSRCSSTWAYTIVNYDTNARMVINGGTFIGTQGAASSSVGYLEVNGGTFKTQDCSYNHGAIFYALYAAGEAGKVECVINGGTFETSGRYAAVLIGNDNKNGDGGINAQATAYVNGGTFTAPEGVPALKGAAETGDPVITGGTFSSDPTAYVNAATHKVTGAGPYEVSAWTEAEAEAKIGSTYYATLADAIAAATSGQTVTLLKNVEITSTLNITDEKNITLNLNEKTITSNIGTAIKIANGELNVTGTGTIDVQYEAFHLAGNNATATFESKSIPAVLTVGPDVVVDSEADCCIYHYGKGVVANIYGKMTSHGLYATIQGQGTVNETKNNGGTVINIYPGASLEQTRVMTIYQPQNGETNIYGGTIKGVSCAVEVRSGSLKVEDGTLISTETTFSCDPNGSGSTTSGAAVAVAQHTTKKDITVAISGGTFTGVKALNESNPQNNDPAPQINLTISGGIFNGEVSTVDVDKFITGGTFSAAPAAAYVADGYAAVWTAANKWKVGRTYTATFNVTPSDATIEVKCGDTVVTDLKNLNTVNTYTYTVSRSGYVTKTGMITAPVSDSATTISVTLNPVYTGGDGGSSTTTPSKPTTSTETKPDGSTTTTESKPDGTVTESNTSKPVTGADGSTSQTTTETTTGKDGVTESKTETTTNKDGSGSATTETTVTKPDGTTTESKTETTINKDGSTASTTTATTTNKDGTVTESKTEATTSTVTNKDGSTTETKQETTTTSTGSKTESTTVTTVNKDGSSTATTTATTTDKAGTVTESKTESTTNKNGTTTEKTTTTETKANGTVTESKTETTINKDGSSKATTTETVTKADGTKVESKTTATTSLSTNKATGTVTETKKETTTTSDGVKSEGTTVTQIQKDGTVTSKETVKASDSTGTTATKTTTLDAKGNVTTAAEATVSTKAVTEAAKTGEAVTLPVEVPTAKTTEAAPTVQVTMPKSDSSVKVEIPVEKVTPGTVAVIVKADGTEKIVSTSVVTENGVALTLEGSATVKLVDNSKSFKDVPETNVFYNEVSSLSAREIMIGKTDDKFDLHNSVTLNQVANVAGRITGKVDVNDFNAGVVWGSENGLKTGNVSATRGEVLKALYVAAGSPTVEDTTILSSFKDASSIPADMAAIAAWAAQNGILKGTIDGKADLSVSVTRGQACALAGRTMGTLA